MLTWLCTEATDITYCVVPDRIRYLGTCKKHEYLDISSVRLPALRTYVVHAVRILEHSLFITRSAVAHSFFELTIEE